MSSRRDPPVGPGTDGRDRDDRRTDGSVGVSPRRRSPVFLAIVGTLAVVFFLIFMALGTWQVKRRAWKLDLIARVEQLVHAPAVAAPGPSEWPGVTAAAYEYKHVTATGTFLDSSQTLVQAVTDLGAGYWVLTPLREPDGSLVLINRGFVAADDRGRVKLGAVPGTPISTVTGLLRVTEPTGAFLRHNNPSANLWYSRDVHAISAARGLGNVAPYFIDAEGSQQPAGPGIPTPGLTVIHFHNSHLVYAITWYTLALMSAIAIPLGMRKQ